MVRMRKLSPQQRRVLEGLIKKSNGSVTVRGGPYYWREKTLGFLVDRDWIVGNIHPFSQEFRITEEGRNALGDEDG